MQKTGECLASESPWGSTHLQKPLEKPAANLTTCAAQSARLAVMESVGDCLASERPWGSHLNPPLGKPSAPCTENGPVLARPLITVDRKPPTMDVQQIKEKSSSAIQSRSEELWDLSQEIWKNPELAFKEHYAHKVLTDFLEKQGFRVDRHYKLETAFRAVCGEEGGVHVCVICEYDALPGIGHGCGHNLIAEVGVAAGIAIKEVIQDFPQPVKVTVLGTPAEEQGGGKNILIDHGCFKDVDFAMMAHPDICSIARWRCLARVRYPLRRLLVSSLLLSLRQLYSSYSMTYIFQTRAVLTGIILDGGIHPDVIPSETKLEFQLRAPLRSDLDGLEEQVVACFKAAATATGCELEYKFNKGPEYYLNVLQNDTLISRYEENSRDLGVEFCTDRKVFAGEMFSGSTDMGNVSHVVPSIHPEFSIGDTAATHSALFTKVAGAPEAQPYTLTQGKVLARIAIDVICQPQLFKKMKEDFKHDIANT
ncbi:peptidase M20 domain-containing protein 2-like [Branchiostoma floridae]|uniref:Peptidase M20 domain-containing protein 2-like n=1 Tax=Branchiostoma floridae TaxID=7739 RepID=A0A9J7LMI6_BRAFL|nr:peptidase M20 domain-containing protein 2-like [Branchiostoma floridae]